MSRQVLARMTRFHVRTSADRPETVCLSGKNGSHRRTGRMTRLTRMYGPAVRRKRFRRSGISGLASMYPFSDWSSLCSEPSWISAHAISLPDRLRKCRSGYAIEINGVPILHRLRGRQLVAWTGFEPLLAISGIQTEWVLLSEASNLSDSGNSGV